MQSTHTCPANTRDSNKQQICWEQCYPSQLLNLTAQPNVPVIPATTGEQRVAYPDNSTRINATKERVPFRSQEGCNHTRLCQREHHRIVRGRPQVNSRTATSCAANKVSLVIA